MVSKQLVDNSVGNFRDPLRDPESFLPPRAPVPEKPLAKQSCAIGVRVIYNRSSCADSLYQHIPML
ncbi:hypothetical protein [Thiohalobacter sp.]|uniref:hypothetical protein n=1 Tax=Thiohalobacter sp. TaxID=2025948 RepID=UPI002612B810|nr:hypothetical protein [Thiohalobacter sp.]